MTLQLRDRRALIALGLASIAYLLISNFVVPAYDRIRAGSQSVAQNEADLRRYRKALASQQGYRESLEQARARVTDTEARLISGGSPSLSSVALQTIVENAARETNLALGQRTISTARKKDEYFSEISMTVSFEGTPNQLTSFLSEVRSAAKFVMVRNLQIAPLALGQETPANGELKKTVKVNATLSAVLADPPAVKPAAGPSRGKK